MTQREEIENVQKLVNNLICNMFADESCFKFTTFVLPRSHAIMVKKILEEIDNQLGHIKNGTLEIYLNKDV